MNRQQFLRYASRFASGLLIARFLPGGLHSASAARCRGDALAPRVRNEGGTATQSWGRVKLRSCENDDVTVYLCEERPSGDWVCTGGKRHSFGGNFDNGIYLSFPVYNPDCATYEFTGRVASGYKIGSGATRIGTANTARIC